MPNVQQPKPLTDKSIRAMAKKPAPKGGRYDVRDPSIPGLYVRINDRGHATFLLNLRYGNRTQPERRVIGRFADTTDKKLRRFTLQDARLEANRWRDLVASGNDPRDELEKQRLANLSLKANTFAAVAEDFISEKLVGERRGKDAERDLRREFIPILGTRPITEITDIEILSIIKAKKKDAPTQARNLLALAKRFFAWAKEQRVYLLKTSPAYDLKPAVHIGAKVSRDRVLSDDELFALWRATRRMPYPYGPSYRLLMLSALRLNEVAEAEKTELSPQLQRLLRERKDDGAVDWTRHDPSELYWTIPAERMKGRPGAARAHVVPITPALGAEFASLPRFTEGQFLFTNTFGKKPAWLGDKVKKDIDRRMLRTLRALARSRGEEASRVTLKHWANHDIRRTVRSQLSRLKVTEEAREALLAHTRPGIKAVYDIHDYFDEKREALELWAARLTSIVSPPLQTTNNVVLLHSK